MHVNNITAWGECSKLHTHFCLLLIYDDDHVLQYVNNTNEMNVILSYTPITVACRHIRH
jgi:hypothetical protein